MSWILQNLQLAGEYAAARTVAVDAVWGLIMGTILASGVPEAIAAAILVVLIGKVMLSVFRNTIQVAA